MNHPEKEEGWQNTIFFTNMSFKLSIKLDLKLDGKMGSYKSGKMRSNKSFSLINKVNQNQLATDEWDSLFFS